MYLEKSPELNEFKNIDLIITCSDSAGALLRKVQMNISNTRFINQLVSSKLLMKFVSQFARGHSHG